MHKLNRAFEVDNLIIYLNIFQNTVTQAWADIYWDEIFLIFFTFTVSKINISFFSPYYIEPLSRVYWIYPYIFDSRGFQSV